MLTDARLPIASLFMLKTQDVLQGVRELLRFRFATGPETTTTRGPRFALMKQQWLRTLLMPTMLVNAARVLKTNWMPVQRWTSQYIPTRTTAHLHSISTAIAVMTSKCL